MSENSFKDLVSSKWRVASEEEVTRFRLRDQYAFVDVAEELADEVVGALADASTGEGPLVVKNATTILAPIPGGVVQPEGQPSESFDDSQEQGS